MDEVTMLLDLQRHVEQNVQLAEVELVLADPKQTIAVEYQKFLETLTETERSQARAVMAVLWPSIRQRVDELKPMMHKLEAMLSRLEASTDVEANVKV